MEKRVLNVVIVNENVKCRELEKCFFFLFKNYCMQQKSSLGQRQMLVDKQQQK
jgi:hypothetical protein